MSLFNQHKKMFGVLAALVIVFLAVLALRAFKVITAGIVNVILIPVTLLVIGWYIYSRGKHL